MAILGMTGERTYGAGWTIGVVGYVGTMGVCTATGARIG